VKVLKSQCEQSKAVRIFMKTEAQKIVTDKSGRVTGVIAKDEDGNPVNVVSKCVIVCTGGFSGNEALIKKYDPTYNRKEVPPAGIPHSGDGIRMATEIGAALDGMLVFEWGGFFTSSPVLTVIARRCQNVWINIKGRRYYDESMPISAEMANALYRQPGRTMCCVFDEPIMQQLKNDSVTVYEELFLGANQETGDNFKQKIERDILRKIMSR
jgi:fumarate reductase flavoprotein subunit